MYLVEDQPFYCDIPGAVYLKSTPSSSCLQALSKAPFSPALLQQSIVPASYIYFLNFKLADHSVHYIGFLFQQET